MTQDNRIAIIQSRLESARQTLSFAKELSGYCRQLRPSEIESIEASMRQCLLELQQIGHNLAVGTLPKR